MALDARLRSSIYQSLVPILGAEEANALMSEFPAGEADELVTKQFLRAELGTLRTEMRGMEGGLRSEMAGMEGGLRAEMEGMSGRLRAEMLAMENRLTVRIGAAMAAQTALLAALRLLG